MCTGREVGFAGYMRMWFVFPQEKGLRKGSRGGGGVLNVQQVKRQS